MSLLLIAAVSKESAANAPALPDEDLSDDDESLAAINAMPIVIGDPESQRRSWIKKAWQARDAKPRRLDDVEAALRAADHLRSSTFTRCNLALVAQERGDLSGAAEYFQRELDTPLADNASERVRFVRHICEMSAALVLERVGKLKVIAPEHSAVWLNHYWVGTAPLSSVVFVKPDEEHLVRVELDNDRELRKTVAVRAGHTATLEFHSPEEVKPKEGLAPKALTLPLVKHVSSGAPAPSGGWGWKEAAGISGGTLLITGLGMMVGAMAWESRIKDAEEAVLKDKGENCMIKEASSFQCSTLNTERNDADRLGWIGLGMILTGAGGVGVYMIPTLMSQFSQTQAKNTTALSSFSLGLRGRW